MIEITPEGSAVPIYLETLTPNYVSELKAESEALTQAIEEEIAKKQMLKESALAKLANLGLTEEEAKAVIGF